MYRQDRDKEYALKSTEVLAMMQLGQIVERIRAEFRVMQQSGRMLRDLLFVGGITTELVLYIMMTSNDAMVIYDKLVLVAAALLSLMCVGLGRVPYIPARWSEWLRSVGVRHVRLFVAGTVIMLLVLLRQWFQVRDYYAVFEAFDVNPDAQYRYANVSLLLWGTGWVYVLAAVVPIRNWWQRFQAHWREFALVSVIAVVAAVLRLVDLGLVPNIINGDEGLIGTWAVGMLRDFGVLSYVFAAIDGVGTNYLYFMAWIFKYGGTNPMTLRLLPAVAGIVAMYTNYLFVRMVFSQRIALITVILLTFSHAHVHFSRQVAVSYIYATALLPLLFLALWKLVETRRMWPAVVVAALLTFHVNVYLDAWAWMVLVVILIGVWAIMDWERVRPVFPQVGIMLGYLGIGVSPMLIWARYFPDDFMSRLSADGSVVTGWIAQEAAARDVGQWQIVLEMYQFAIGTFFNRPFEDFYHANVPTLDVVSAMLFGIGLFLVHNLLHTRRMMMLLGWFWGGVTALAVFTVPLSTYHYRLLVVLPVVYIMVAYTYDWLIERAQKQMGKVQIWLIVGVFLSMFVIQNTRVYQQQLVQVCRYGGDLKTRQSGWMGNYFYTNDIHTGVVVVYGDRDAFHYGPWRSVDFLAPDLEFVNDDEVAYLDELLNSNIPHWYVAIPERVTELERLKVQYNISNDLIPIYDCDEPVLYILAHQDVRDE